MEKNSRIIEYIEENLKKCIRSSKEDNGDLLGVPYSYTVPSTVIFDELYYWDTYFTNIGLIKMGKAELAKNNTDNILYLVNKYGFMPNGNRTFFLNRSQPPFLSEMVKDIYEYYRDKVWLAGAYSALIKEYDFWMTRRITKIGLNRYDSDATDEELTMMAKMFNDRTGINAEENTLDLGRHMLATAESGWDITPRWGTKAYDYAPVDLNSLLYGFERNMEYFSRELENGENELWKKRAEKRAELMNKYLIGDDKIFSDYNFENENYSNVFSVAAYYTMFNNVATREQAAMLVKNLDRIEERFGIATCEKQESKIDYQWDWPNGWPCLQYITVRALGNYGYIEEARRIAEKYINLVENVFEKTHNFWEKYNVAEGNINVTNEYEMPTMLGWSAGVYVCIKDFLNSIYDN